MAKVSQREKILLGYNLNYSLSNSSSRKNSEVDFSDVFGGPPRWSSSTQANDIDDDDGDNIDSIDGEEYGAWLGSMEKPVFGNQTGVRKRYPSDDFYDDIFGGDQPLLSCSLTPSPRVVMPGRNPLSSTPGSRTMSPSRPSSVTEPCSSPSKFSLPAGRMTNADVMTSTSMNQNFKFFGRSLSRFNHTIPSHSSLNGDDAPNSYQPSSLSRQASADEKDLTSERKVDGTTDQHESEFNVKESRGSKFANDNMQFHFSIYKWANKGVPMVMSSRKRSPSGSKERLTSDANMVMDSNKGVLDVNGSLSSSKRRLSSTPKTRELEHSNDIVVGGMSVECKLEGDKTESPTIEVGEACCGEGPVGVKELPVHSETVSDAKSIEHTSKTRKSHKKPLHALFGEDKEGNKKATAEKGRKQTKVNETKKPNQKNDVLSKIYRKSKVHESFTREKDDRHRDEVPTKVKDYVRFLNQDSFSQVKSSVTGQSRNDRCTTRLFEVRNEVNSYSTKNHDEMQDFSVNLEKTWSESVEVVDGEAFLSEEHEYSINDGPNVAGSSSNDEPNIDGIRASAPKTSATSVNDNLGKGLVQTVDSQSATESQEEMQLYEQKVRQWSKGKEGNIRALLSTMQNVTVLWPNSGWKPIPLVDIIEANAVKKAYQRALLCLHPDKLQQKGAAPYQRLIAEKMFDILQEAWDQFNSLGML